MVKIGALYPIKHVVGVIGRATRPIGEGIEFIEQVVEIVDREDREGIFYRYIVLAQFPVNLGISYSTRYLILESRLTEKVLLMSLPLYVSWKCTPRFQEIIFCLGDRS